MILGSSVEFLSLKLEDLSLSEIELWIYKALSIYSGQIKDINKKQVLLRNVSYILQIDGIETAISDELFNSLITLEDNLQYDLSIHKS